MSLNHKEGCPLCGRSESRRKKFYLDLGKYSEGLAIYAESEHYIATPDMHPIIRDPYFLVYPKEHLTSFLKTSPAQEQEMHQLVARLRELSEKDSVIIFEHGQMADGNKVKSVYHARTHIIPTNERNMLAKIARTLLETGIQPVEVNFDTYSTIRELQQHVEGDYLLFRFDGKGFIVKDDGTVDIPSQFFRVVLARIMLPEEEFINWKTANREQIAILRRRLLKYPTPR